MAYSSPQVNDLLDRFAVSVDVREQTALHREIVRDVLGEVVFIPLYWEMQPVLMLSSVAAEIHANNPGWNAATWDKRS